MNWFNELYELYEKNSNIAGDVKLKTIHTKKGDEDIPLILLPVFHTTVAAQITVSISKEGEFIDAEEVPVKDKLTIVPVTEGSASRTSKESPHPFCDNLKYVAGDYMSYYRQKEKDSKNNKERNYYINNFIPYITKLGKWNDSAYAHPKVKALYRYLEKKTLIKDLCKANVIHLTADGYMQEGEKIQNISIEDAFVRFRIVDENSPLYECWLDKSLQETFIAYYSTIIQDKDFCYLTGEIIPITYLQPKKIRHEGDGAKLISSNDSSNFTYRGRFDDYRQAFSIGYIPSQKAQNALKWIIRKQGFSIGDLYFVTWESNLSTIPEWQQDTDDIITNEWDNADIDKRPVDTGEAAAAEFAAVLKGYYSRLGDMSTIVLLALDAATTGRLALVENKVFTAAKYIENIKYWHESCFWAQVKYKNGQLYRYYGVAGIDDIIRSLYGTEQQGMLTINNKKLQALLYRRLLPCITDRKHIPADMVQTAIVRASSPQSYGKRYNWEKVLDIACSLVKNTENKRENKKEEWTLALNERSTDRSYLYGRLLAIADRIEASTYTQEEKKRVTNAMRYMTAFSQHPFTTWQRIEEQIQPYLQKMEGGLRYYYNDKINKVMQNFSEEKFGSNKALDGKYLLGYHNQMSDLRTKKNKDDLVNRDEKVEVSNE